MFHHYKLVLATTQIKDLQSKCLNLPSSHLLSNLRSNQHQSQFGYNKGAHHHEDKSIIKVLQSADVYVCISNQMHWKKQVACFLFVCLVLFCFLICKTFLHHTRIRNTKDVVLWLGVEPPEETTSSQQLFISLKFAKNLSMTKNLLLFKQFF